MTAEAPVILGRVFQLVEIELLKNSGQTGWGSYLEEDCSKSRVLEREADLLPTDEHLQLLGREHHVEGALRRHKVEAPLERRRSYR